MTLLLDTNILLRLGDKTHAMHRDALNSIELLDRQGVECVIVPQVLYEYWVVATRPLDRNGLEMSVTTVEAALTKWCSVFRLLRDERGVFSRWRDLVTTHAVQGKLAHDARLVAAMQRHGVKHLLTFNVGDFERFSEILVYAPGDIVAGRMPM
jgi:predicted nucleic acid-binding protein